MKIKSLLHVIVLSLMSAVLFAAPIPVGQIELGPYDVPWADYDYADYSAGAVVNFENVEMLKVLGPLDLDDVSYYFTPGEGLGNGDYNGDIEGADGFIQFNEPGPYFVEITWVGGAKEYRAYAVDFVIRAPGGSSRWRKIPTPSPDVVITDPDFVDSNPDFPPRPPKPPTVEVNDKPDWPSIKNYLRTLKNAHVELGGHGKPGTLYWKGKRILDKYNIEQELEDLKGHVSNLTFMACEVGADPNFIQDVADILGESSGYTTSVGGNGKDWFIADGGTIVTKTKNVSTDDCAMHANVAYVSPDAQMLVLSGTDEDASRVYTSATVTLAEASSPSAPIISEVLSGVEMDSIDGSFAKSVQLPGSLMLGLDYVLTVQYDYQTIEEAYVQTLSFVPAEEQVVHTHGPDIDGSGCVDLFDFVIFADYWMTDECCFE